LSEKRRRAGVTMGMIEKSEHGFGTPNRLLKLDVDTYYGRMKWAYELIKDIRLALRI
jgi:hypothetical protein